MYEESAQNVIIYEKLLLRLLMFWLQAYLRHHTNE